MTGSALEVTLDELEQAALFVHRTMSPTPVNNPLALIVPSVDGDNVQATPAVEPTTGGVNCSVPPTLIVALVGAIDTPNRG